jgi:NADP-dependent 3-hydroxy acid dehydrogenase YdfG
MRPDPVAIVTGGSCDSGREIARGLASRRWAIVVVYLEDQRTVEAAVVDILAAGGTIVAVRADLADAFDVQRLFAESTAAFGGVDVVAHTTTERGSLLYARAARHLRAGGVIVTATGADRVTHPIAGQMRDRGIDVGRAPPQEILAFLDRWRARE